MPGKNLPLLRPPAPPAVEASVPLPPLDHVQQGSGGKARGEGAVWRQIAAALRGPIQRGEWQPGARLPIELELAAHFRVNRHTVRRALADLARDGLIATMQGRGTFITAGEKVRYHLDGQDPISDAVWPGLTTLSSALVRDRKVEAGVKMGAKLALPSIHGLHEVELRLTADDVPLALATIRLARDTFPHFIDVLRKAGSLQLALASYGYDRFQPTATTVSARLADDRECGLFKTKAPTMLTVVEAVAGHFGDNGSPAPIFVIQTALCSARVDLHVVHASPVI
ncbi:MAG: GntR family transcriptional regulator [Pseudomonadota bacterium]